MGAGANPTIPSVWEIYVLSLGVVLVSLVIVTVLSLAWTKNLAPATKLLWLLIILALPLMGPLGWLLCLYRIRRTGSASKARTADPTRVDPTAASPELKTRF